MVMRNPYLLHTMIEDAQAVKFLMMTPRLVLFAVLRILGHHVQIQRSDKYI